MIKNGFGKDIWPTIFKELSDKKISYAVTPNTYPKKQEWTKHHHHEISILLEDPDRPPIPGKASLFSCWLVFKLTNGRLSIYTNLSIYLSRSIDIQDILTIMDHPYFSNYPSLTVDDLPSLGPHYCLSFDSSISTSPSAPLLDLDSALKRKICLIEEIVNTLYIIEKDSQDKKAIEKLTDLLLEIQ